MKKTQIIALVTLAFLLVYILYALFSDTRREPPTAIEYLPSEATLVTFVHQGELFDFTQNNETSDGGEVTIAGDVVYGNVDGDEREDALVPFVVSGEDGYYAALAIREADGYVGMNTVFLGSSETLPVLHIANEIVSVDVVSGGATSTLYFTLVGSELVRRTVEEPFLYGWYRFNRDRAYFDTCEDETVLIATSSPSYTVLRTIYREKRHSNLSEKGVFAVVTGSNTPIASQEAHVQDLTEELTISTIVQVPERGSCPVHEGD